LAIDVYLGEAPAIGKTEEEFIRPSSRRTSLFKTYVPLQDVRPPKDVRLEEGRPFFGKHPLTPVLRGTCISSSMTGFPKDSRS